MGRQVNGKYSYHSQNVKICILMDILVPPSTHAINILTCAIKLIYFTLNGLLVQTKFVHFLHFIQAIQIFTPNCICKIECLQTNRHNVFHTKIYWDKKLTFSANLNLFYYGNKMLSNKVTIAFAHSSVHTLLQCLRL